MDEFDLWFTLLKISDRLKINFIKRFKTTKEVWYYTVNELNKKSSLDCDINNKKVLQLKNDLLCNNISMVTYFDNEYPKELKKYDDSPYTLFYKGNIKPLNKHKSVSIVGSRQCSIYGANVAEVVAKEMCAGNVNVVSGLAKGIDAHAHKACVENEGFTCAILGCGLDIVYPKQNAKLYSDILNYGGCIMSQFIPRTAPIGYNFPIRNRVISSLSEVTIIVEAGLKSGSLITASAALDQGRDVMAVPGSIFSKNSEGTNRLLRDGAIPLLSCKDVFETLKINYKTKEQKKDYKIGLERQIYEVISDNPIHIDDIIKITGVDITQIYELLFKMQLKKEIMCLNGNYYVKINKCI